MSLTTGINCAEPVGTGLGDCKDLMEESLKYVLAKRSWMLDVANDNLNQAKWLEGIQCRDLIVLPEHIFIEDAAKGVSRVETTAGVDRKTGGEIYGFMIGFEPDRCLQRALKTIKGNFALLGITSDQRLEGIITNDVFRGIELANAEFDKVIRQIRGTSGQIDLFIQMSRSGSELYESSNYAIVPDDFSLLDIQGILDVNLEIVGAPASGSLTIRATQSCNANTAVVGLESGLVVIDVATGLPVAATWTQNADGSYSTTDVSATGDYNVLLFDTNVAKSAIIIDTQVYQSNTVNFQLA